MVLVLVNHLPPSSQLKTAIFHIVDTIMGHIKVREVKNHDRETRIQQAIEERTKKRTTLRNLAILYKIPRSTFSDRIRGIHSHHEAQKKYQAVSPAVERSLIRWVDDMDAGGFPPRLNLFKATAVRLVSEKEGPPLGSTWLGGFPNRHPELSSKFASGFNRQRALSSKPGPIKDYFQKLRCSFENTTSFLIIYIIRTEKAPPWDVQTGKSYHEEGKRTASRNRGWIARVDYSCLNLLCQQHHASTNGYLPN